MLRAHVAEALWEKLAARAERKKIADIARKVSRIVFSSLATSTLNFHRRN